MITLAEEATTTWVGEAGAPPAEHLGVDVSEEPPARLQPLQELGWSVECRGCYWLAQREHRRIELFRDGRVVFKDPTIRARYQLDDEWLNVIRFVWPDVQL